MGNPVKMYKKLVDRGVIPPVPHADADFDVKSNKANNTPNNTQAKHKGIDFSYILNLPISKKIEIKYNILKEYFKTYASRIERKLYPTDAHLRMIATDINTPLPKIKRGNKKMSENKKTPTSKTPVYPKTHKENQTLLKEIGLDVVESIGREDWTSDEVKDADQFIYRNKAKSINKKLYFDTETNIFRTGGYKDIRYINNTNKIITIMDRKGVPMQIKPSTRMFDLDVVNPYNRSEFKDRLVIITRIFYTLSGIMSLYKQYKNSSKLAEEADINTYIKQFLEQAEHILLKHGNITEDQMSFSKDTNLDKSDINKINPQYKNVSSSEYFEYVNGHNPIVHNNDRYMISIVETYNLSNLVKDKVYHLEGEDITLSVGETVPLHPNLNIVRADQTMPYTLLDASIQSSGGEDSHLRTYDIVCSKANRFNYPILNRDKTLYVNYYIIDNQNRIKNRYINIAGEIHEVPVVRDLNYKDGFYTIKVSNGKTQYLRNSFTEVNNILFETEQEALYNGNLDIKVQKELKEKEEELFRIKQDLEMTLANEKKERLERESELERLKHEYRKEEISKNTLLQETEFKLNQLKQENQRLKELIDTKNYKIKEDLINKDNELTQLKHQFKLQTMEEESKIKEKEKEILILKQENQRLQEEINNAKLNLEIELQHEREHIMHLENSLKKKMRKMKKKELKKQAKIKKKMKKSEKKKSKIKNHFKELEFNRKMELEKLKSENSIYRHKIEKDVLHAKEKSEKAKRLADLTKLGLAIFAVGVGVLKTLRS